MHHDKRSKRSTSGRRGRILLATLGIAATITAAAVAASAVPAFANGSNGQSGSHSQSALHSQSASHSQSSLHSQSSAHSTSASHSQKSSKGKSSSKASSGGNSANAHEHVTICHATPPDTAANGYVEISPSAAGVYNGHLKEHAADIIPPFTYSGQTYSLNWDETGQAIFANGCAVPETTTTTAASVEGASHGKGSSHGKGAGKANGKSNGESGTRGNSANAHEHVTICHAAPPDTAANGYVEISPSAAGVYNGHLKEHAADIIPPFTYSGQTYSLNWDETGQAIFANGCMTPAVAAATFTLSTTINSSETVKSAKKFVASAKATVAAILAALNTKSSTSKSTKSGGVLAANKTLKRVSHHTRAARAVVRSATFTG